MSSSKSIDWFELGLSRKEARGLNNYDLGEVQEVGQTYVVTQKGTIKKEKFYIPKYLAEGYDGEVLRFKLTEAEAKNKFVNTNYIRWCFVRFSISGASQPIYTEKIILVLALFYITIAISLFVMPVIYHLLQFPYTDVD